MNELPQAIFRKWMHSREEDRDGITVYRDPSYPHPPARGRDGIEFRPGGEFIDWGIGAGDYGQANKGRWDAVDTTHVRITFADGRPSRTLEIVHCAPDILEVR
jgi:hypothetical protein